MICWYLSKIFDSVKTIAFKTIAFKTIAFSASPISDEDRVYFLCENGSSDALKIDQTHPNPGENMKFRWPM